MDDSLGAQLDSFSSHYVAIYDAGNDRDGYINDSVNPR
jgi:hypothetical protein